MTTLISWGTGGGRKGRCDARCHNAKRPKCKCCCGGHYHGAARDGTLSKKVEQFQEAILRDLRERGLDYMTTPMKL